MKNTDVHIFVWREYVGFFFFHSYLKETGKKNNQFLTLSVALATFTVTHKH